MKVYDNAKLAISELANIDKSALKLFRRSGAEHDRLYSYNDKIFKVTPSRQEFLASKRLIGKDFNNVVKIFNSFECCVLSDYDRVTKWKSYIIEEEKLKKSGFLNDLTLYDLSCNIEKKLSYYVDIINGLIELSSVGIIHNDIHTLNTMKDDNGNVKIIDFGFATIKKKYNKLNKKIILK